MAGYYWVAFVDIAGQPVRATTLPYPVTFSGTGDDDLDGFTFVALDHKLVDIGPVSQGKGGSDTVTAALAGLPGVDDDLLEALDTKSNWQGRDARLWRGTFVGSTPAAPTPYYTGTINRLLDSFIPAQGDQPATRRIEVEIENYLSMLTTARSRTYQDQTEHDAGDLSPLRMRSAANGTQGSGIGGVGGGSAAGGAGARDQMMVNLA